MRKPQDQPGECHDGTYGSDDAVYTAEPWDWSEELLRQNDDDVFDDDDEVINSLIQGESDALKQRQHVTQDCPDRNKQNGKRQDGLQAWFLHGCTINQTLPDPRVNSSMTAIAEVVVSKVEVKSTNRLMCMLRLNSTILKVHLGLIGIVGAGS